MLHQGDGAVAYFSRAVAAHHAKLPAYERELIGLVKAVRHWQPYLWGRSFIVRTDHWSLKYILDQRLTTIPQHTWVTKLFGYDLTVKYCAGKLNTLADALSRRDSDIPSVRAVSAPTSALYDDLRLEHLHDLQAQGLRAQIAARAAPDGWALLDDMLMYRGRLFVPDASVSR